MIETSTRVEQVKERALEIRRLVVEMAYAAGGGSSIYESSPLQRRLRDVRTLTQHIGVSRDAFALTGALLAGEDVDPMKLA